MAAHEEPLPDVATFGRAVPEPLRTEVQNRLLEIMQAPGVRARAARVGRRSRLPLLTRPTPQRRFPGSQPVSFESIHFGLVKSQPYGSSAPRRVARFPAHPPSPHRRRCSYLVCEKTDGSRYLLIVHEGRAYMVGATARWFPRSRVSPRACADAQVDRKFQVTEVPLVFPALQEARPDMRVRIPFILECGRRLKAARLARAGAGTADALGNHPGRRAGDGHTGTSCRARGWPALLL